jgi:hypothetical protein
MFESELCGLNHPVPCGGPFSGGLDFTLWLDCTEGNLSVSHAPNALFSRLRSVEVAEDDVEVDGLASDDTFPLSGGETGRGEWRVFDFQFDLLDVIGECLEYFPSLLASGRGWIDAISMFVVPGHVERRESTTFGGPVIVVVSCIVVWDSVNGRMPS